MMWYTHLVGGGVAAMLVQRHFLGHYEVSSWQVMGLVGASGLGALVADVDHPKSKVGRRLSWVSQIVNDTVGHRTLTHSLLSVMLMALLPIWARQGYSVLFYGALGLLIGHLSHLILDFMTVAGISVFYPFSKKLFGLGLVKTNAYSEIVFLCVMTIYGVSLIQ